MNQRVKEIFEKAQALPPEEREELGELLLSTVAAEFNFDEVWSTEAARRWNDFAAGSEPSIDALEAVEAARATRKPQG